jgi:hypothetical protein
VAQCGELGLQFSVADPDDFPIACDNPCILTMMDPVKLIVDPSNYTAQSRKYASVKSKGQHAAKLT